jgi:hypothetical protein
MEDGHGPTSTFKVSIGDNGKLPCSCLAEVVVEAVGLAIGGVGVVVVGVNKWRVVAA